MWNDADGDGQQDGSEGGIDGVTVHLFQDDGDGNFEPGTDDVLIATALTTGGGNYQFTVATAGAYWVHVDESSPSLSGLTHISGPESQTNPHLVTLSPGDTYLLADFGYAGRGNIAGTVFYDWDEDGQQDPGEDGIPNVEVCLYEDNGDRAFSGGDVLQTCQTTQSDGTYLFAGYLPGVYLIVETQPAGLQSTQPSNNVRVVDLIVSGATGSSTDNNFGEIVKGRIGDFVWVDSNGNGVQDPGETTPVANVPLQLTGITITGTTVNRTTTSSSMGTYLFDDLIPGTYTVTVPTTFSGYVLTTSNARTTTLSIGAMEDLTLDFGYIFPTAVSLTSFIIQAEVTGVRMEWSVRLDGETPMFTVWRALPGGRWKQLTPLPLTALWITGNTAYYGYEDASITPGQTYLYQLESSSGERFGPWEVTVPEVDDGGSTILSPSAFLPFVSR